MIEYVYGYLPEKGWCSCGIIVHHVNLTLKQIFFESPQEWLLAGNPTGSFSESGCQVEAGAVSRKACNVRAITTVASMPEVAAQVALGEALERSVNPFHAHCGTGASLSLF